MDGARIHPSMRHHPVELLVSMGVKSAQSCTSVALQVQLASMQHQLPQPVFVAPCAKSNWE